MRRRLLSASCLVLVLALAACGTSGRDLQPKVAGATAPPRSVSTTLAPASSVSSSGLNLSSPLVGAGQRLPNEFTCSGAGVSPPLAIGGVPPGTGSLALAVTDQDQGGAVLWLVTGIPATTTAIEKGTPPAGGIEQPNNFKATAWQPPCSTETHTYEFNLLSFTDPPVVDPTAEPQKTVSDLQQKASGSAVFSTKFGTGSSPTTT